MSTADNPPGAARSGSTSAFDWVVVGKIGRAQGIRGDVGVEPRTDSPDERFATSAILRAGPPAISELTVASHRWHSGRLIVRFEGIGDRTAAEAIRGSVLEAFIDTSATPTDPDEYYDRQLVGLSAVTLSGEQLGIVTEVVHLPSQDLLAITAADTRQVLVPFIAQMVPSVDLIAGVVTIDPPVGLIESQAPSATAAQDGATAARDSSRE
ncbi:MAG: ribosome maturation factor RimM [Candidatus Nanopelagicales bacterium]